MSDEIELVATFGDEHGCAHAIEALHAAGIHSFQAFAPFPSEVILEATAEARHLGRSYVRWFVLLGGITGFIGAVILTIGTSYEWNLNTGGKAIASIPPFIVIMFELMILIGGISGVIGFFLTNRMPAFESAPGYRSRFGADKFGLVVHCPPAESGKVEAILHDVGVEDIQREAA